MATAALEAAAIPAFSASRFTRIRSSSAAYRSSTAIVSVDVDASSTAQSSQDRYNCALRDSRVSVRTSGGVL
jgi:hypothetical protein